MYIFSLTDEQRSILLKALDFLSEDLEDSRRHFPHLENEDELCAEEAAVQEVYDLLNTAGRAQTPMTDIIVCCCDGLVEHVYTNAPSDDVRVSVCDVTDETARTAAVRSDLSDAFAASVKSGLEFSSTVDAAVQLLMTVRQTDDRPDDYISNYVELARDTASKQTLRVSLVNNVTDGVDTFSLHVLDDITPRDGFFVPIDHIADLSRILSEIAGVG